MRSQFQSGKLQHLVTILKEAGGYAAAIVLPWISTGISVRFYALRTTPLILGFVSVAGIAHFCGIRPAIVSILSTTLAFNYYIVTPAKVWPPSDLEAALRVFEALRVTRADGNLAEPL